MKIRVLLLLPVLFVILLLMVAVGMARVIAWSVKSLLDLVGSGLARLAVDLCASADPLVPDMATRLERLSESADTRYARGADTTSATQGSDS